MRFTRRSVLGASAATSLLVLAACTRADEADGGNGGGSGGSDGGGESIASDANDINAQERSALGEGGVLRLTNNAFPANWNTFSSDGNEANTIRISETMQPLLVISDAAGVVSANPDYTQSVELTGEDPQVVEVKLNPDMKWSDGTALDWKSVKNVFDVMSGKDDEYAIASSEGYSKVESVEQGDDELTAVITFAEPYADWMGLISAMPDELAESPETFNEGWKKEPGVTAGPFKIGKIDANNKTVTVVPDENWWGEKPLLEQILFTTIEDPAAAATSFQNGQLDSIETSVPATYTVLEPMVGQGATLRTAAGPNWTHLTLNGAAGRPLEDKLVRQAFFMAMDREEIFQSVNAVMPYPEGAGRLDNHLLMANQEGYVANAGELGEQDLEGAKAKLEEAGYDVSGEWATKDGKELAITYTYNEGSKTNEAVAPVVQEALKEIGIKMDVRTVPPTDLFSKYVIPGDFDITLFGWNGTPFLSSGDAIWKTGGEQNFGKIGDEETDKLIEQAAVETDPQARLDLINEIDVRLWDLAGVLPLWQGYTFMIQHDDLANFGAFGFQTPDWKNIGYMADSDKLNG